MDDCSWCHHPWSEHDVATGCCHVEGKRACECDRPPPSPIEMPQGSGCGLVVLALAVLFAFLVA